ncbi:MAG TPA: T9SS type A sorting domain-containing protein [Bacteroidia bacterium]|nr:T9SS type A sorting domain-containing protein [Bacteroidia bacterium]
MKKIYFFAALMLSSFAAYSQCSVIVTGSTNVSCNGACDGTVSLTTLGIPTYTYAWSPQGQTIQNPQDLCPGTHTVVMTDANSCQSTATVLITEPGVLTPSSQQTDVTCNGDCDGSATVTPSGGTQPYTYAWDSAAGNQTTATANNLCAGTYSVTVTDFNGCTAMHQVQITQPPPLTTTTSTLPATCQACTDGSASVYPSGGTPSYDYVWMPGGQTTQTASNLGGGTYTVVTTDAQGCTQTDTVTVFAPTGIIASNSGVSVSVFPNPVVNMANIEITNAPAGGVLLVSVFDVTGKLIESTQHNAAQHDVVQVSFENLPAGVYLMEIRMGDAKMTVKIFRQ